jgi:hypothetical protein
MPRPDPVDLPGRKHRSPRARVYLWLHDQPYPVWPLWVGTITLLLCSMGLAPGAAPPVVHHLGGFRADWDR